MIRPEWLPPRFRRDLALLLTWQGFMAVAWLAGWLPGYPR